MKKMKKILAMFLAMAMVLGMSVTTFAAPGEGETPQETNSTQVEISGLTAKTSFKAYRFIKPVYNKSGLTGYEWAVDVGEAIKSGMKVEFNKNNQVVGLDAALVTKLSNDEVFLNVAESTKDYDDGLKDYFEFVDQTPVDGRVNITLNAGMWIVIPTDAGENPTVVYNPMLIGVYYTTNNSTGMAAGEVDASKAWSLYGTDAFAKSTDTSKPGEEPKKTVKDSATGEVGSTKTFTLSGVVPSYSDEFFELDAAGNVKEDSETRKVVYKLKDSCAAGLQYTGVPTVYVGGVDDEHKVTESNYTVTYYTGVNCEGDTTTEAAGAKSFSVTLKPSYIRSLQDKLTTGARDIKVVYNAKITDAAVKKAAENTFVVEYTRVPGVDEDSKSETDSSDVYTYTASINGLVKKIGEGDDVQSLAGAQFKLYREYSAGALSDEFLTSVDTATDDGGQVKFTGLEFGKTYYMQETKAPTGYSVNDTVYSVICSYPADLDQEALKDGTMNLTKYDVTITKLTNLTKEEQEDESKRVTKFSDVVYADGDARVMVGSPLVIQNTKMASLPSTGGIGTTIFTVGGCAIMIIAAGLYFASRRRAAK